MDTPLHQSIYIMTLNTLWGGRGTGSELEGAWRGATPAFYPPARLSNCTIKACQKYSNKSNGTARQHACTTPARTLPSAQGVRYRMLYVVLSGQATRGRDGAFRDIAMGPSAWQWAPASKLAAEFWQTSLHAVRVLTSGAQARRGAQPVCAPARVPPWACRDVRRGRDHVHASDADH